MIQPAVLNYPRSNGGVVFGFVFTVLLIGGAGYWFWLEHPAITRAAAVSSTAAPQAASEEPSVAPQPQSPKWEHAVARDDLDGSEQRFATLPSTNLVNFPFPYNRPQHAVLRVSEDKSGSFLVSVHVDRGQFDWDFDEYGMLTHLRLRFYEGPVQDFDMRQWKDHNAVLSGQSELISQLQSASFSQSDHRISHQQISALPRTRLRD